MKNQLREECNTDELWTFACEFYDIEGNKKSLLFLQDEAGMNVNLLIFCFYLCTKGILLNEDGLAFFADKNKELDSLTSKLRAHRKDSKPRPNSLDREALEEYYKRLLDRELNYEKQQQSLLLESLFTLFEQPRDANESQNDIEGAILIDVNILNEKSIRELDVEADAIVKAALCFYKSKSPATEHHMNKVASAYRRYAIGVLL